MRIIAFMLFFALSIYSILDIFNEVREESKMLKGNLYAPLKERIFIPSGMEKEYVQILKTFNLDKETFLKKEELVLAKINQKSKNTKNYKQKTHKSVLKNKIKSYGVKNNHLIINLYVYNPLQIAVDKKLDISCSLLDSNGIVVDIFDWQTPSKIYIKPHKTILITNVDLGYVNNYDFKNISCEVY